MIVIVTFEGDIAYCQDCAKHKDNKFMQAMIGPGKTFEWSCPHVEAVFLRWRRRMKKQEPADLRSVLIGLGFGILLTGSAWLSLSFT